MELQRLLFAMLVVGSITWTVYSIVRGFVGSLDEHRDARRRNQAHPRSWR